jgi:hypothetical protein
MTDKHCAGINTKGKPCQARPLGDLMTKSHLTTDEPWYCHNHKNQGATK